MRKQLLLTYGRIIFFVVLGILGYSTAYAGDFPEKDWKTVSPESQGINGDKLQKAVDYLSDELKKQGSDPGGIFIVRNGQVVWSNENSRTIYQVASVSKSFLSTGLGLMIQDGKVKLSTLAKNIDKRIGDYYPGATCF
jgi:CubicO group peptidase (beta-lactamase class C family)